MIEDDTDVNETEDLFCEIQNEGMYDIGTSVTFEIDGKTYKGVLGDPSIVTQMLTGSYQGRAEVIIKATRSQFASMPTQRADITITAPDILAQSQWRLKQTDVDGASHYDFHLMKQLPQP